MLKQISRYSNKNNKRKCTISFTMNVLESELVLCMGSGLGNCDGSVDVPYSTMFSLQPYFQ